MQNFSTFPKSLKCALVCQLPDCSCEKCLQLRSEGKPDQSIKKRCLNLRGENINKDIFKNAEDCVNEWGPSNRVANKSKRFGIGLCSTPPNLAPSNFESFLFDIVGIISFFILGSLMFWFTVSQYLWYVGKMVLQSGRVLKLLVSAVILLLAISITMHAFKSCLKHQQNIPLEKISSDPLLSQKNSTEEEPQEEKQNVNQSLSSNSLEETKRNPSLCDLCAKTFKSDSNSQTSLTDEEILEMIKTYRLSSAACEMKFPPSFSNIIEIVTGSTANSFTGSQF